MTKARWTGVALCETLDLIGLFGRAFAENAPDIELLAPEDIDDPAGVDFALCWHPADRAFDPYPRLRAVFSIAAGTDRILACPSLPDVPVFRVEDPDQAFQMAGFAAFHVIWHHRRMGHYLDAQARRSWERPAAGRSPAQCRVGVMGFGFMGRAVARGIAALGYPVTTLTRHLPDPLDPAIAHMTAAQQGAFLARSDILVNVLPMTAATHCLFDEALFGALPRGAAFVHLGRGPQLDESALLAALETGQLVGASLDVFAQEPLPRTHPFWDHPSIVVTPHTAGEPEAPAVVASVQRGLAALQCADGNSSIRKR